MFQRFASVIGESHWRDRVRKCKQEIRGNVFLRDYLLQEYAIAFQLDHLSGLAQRHGRVPLAAAEDRKLYPAASFAVQVLSILDSSPRQEAERFRRRVHGALGNPDDMRGLRLELSAATHFSRRGKRVSWLEATNEGGFDLLVEGESHPPLEVECKSIGEDKGRRIHRREVIDFAALLKPHLRPTIAGLSKGLAVVVTVPDKLSNRYQERIEFAKCLGRAIFAGRSCQLSDGSDIRIADFDAGLVGDARDLSHKELRATVDSISGTTNHSAIVIGTQSGGLLAITIQSRRDDKLLASVFDTLSDAARRQLTQTRAGMLFAGFDSLEGEELLSIAAQDQDSSQQPTSLRVAVSRFLAAPTRDHVIGVAFISKSGLQPVEPGLVASSGAAYYFPKRESAFWSNGFSGIFDALPG